MKKIKLTLRRGTVFTTIIDDKLAYELVEDFRKGRFNTLTIETKDYSNTFADIDDIVIVEERVLRVDINE